MTKEVGFNSWQGQELFFSHNIQTALGAYPSSYTIETRDCFTRIEWQGCKADYTPTSSAELKNSGAIPPFPHMSSGYNALFIKQRKNFTFSLPFNPCIHCA
jgi:hypothetical protein